MMGEPETDVAAMDDVLGPPPEPVKKEKKGIFARLFSRDEESAAEASEAQETTEGDNGEAPELVSGRAARGMKGAMKTKHVKIPKDPKKLQQLIAKLQDTYLIIRKQTEEREAALRQVNDLIKQRQREYADREKTLSGKEKFLHELTVDLAEKKTKLSEKEDKLREKEEHLTGLEESLIQREHDLKKARVDFEHEMARLHREQQHLSDEIIELSAKRQTLAVAIQDEHARLKDIQSLISKQLSEHDTRTRKVAKGEENLLRFKSELDRMAIALKGRDETLTGKEKDLGTREKTLVDANAVHERESKQWRDELAGLDARKRGLDQQILEKENYLKDLEQNEKLLSDKETEIINSIKELEEDEKLLEERQQEIIETVRVLEEDRRQLDEKEKEFIAVIDKLEKKDSEFRTWERKLEQKEKELATREQDLKQVEDEVIKMRDDLEEKEKKIARVKELKANEDQLQKRIEQLNQEIAKLSTKKLRIMEIKELEAHVQELKIQRERLRTELEKEKDALELQINKLTAKVTDMEEYKRLERQLALREEFLTRKEEELDKAWQTVRREEDHLSDRALHTAPAEMEDIRTIAEMHSDIARADTPLQLGIYTVIAKTRDALKRGDLATARQLYNQLKPMYTKLRVGNDERKKIYYEVLELKTDIELSALA